MKFRYQITAQLSVINVATGLAVIPTEQFVTLYDSPYKLNFLDPVHQVLLKRVAKITFEMQLLETDRLKDIGMVDDVTMIHYIDQVYLKQIRKKNQEL